MSIKAKLKNKSSKSISSEHSDNKMELFLARYLYCSILIHQVMVSVFHFLSNSMNMLIYQFYNKKLQTFQFILSSGRYLGNLISNCECWCLVLNKTIKSNNMNAVLVATVHWGHDLYGVSILIPSQVIYPGTSFSSFL